MIEAAGIVVPAHDEETLLPACLSALQQAVCLVSIPVHVLVAADSCTDGTVAVARAYGAEVISIQARSVGAARAAGMAEVLRLTAGADPAAVWLATTDADTMVPPGWLRLQLARAGQGWDVVLGTVTVTDWSEHPPHVPTAFAPATNPAAGRTPTCTARTSASEPRPTWPPEGSCHCAPPKTTRWSPPRLVPDARSFGPAISRYRPPLAARPSRRWGSAICCGRWPLLRRPSASAGPPGYRPHAGKPGSPSRYRLRPPGLLTARSWSSRAWP